MTNHQHPLHVLPGWPELGTSGNVVEVFPEYKGPQTEGALSFDIPDRDFTDVPEHMEPITLKGLSQSDLLQVDGRLVESEHKWSGFRVMLRADALNVAEGKTELNVASGRLGKAAGYATDWVEIGMMRSARDGVLRLFSFDARQDERYRFVGEGIPGKWYEFSLRIRETRESKTYEAFCNGIKIRTGVLPDLRNRFDIAHESWTKTGVLCKGDAVLVEEGWLYTPNGKAHWLGPDIPLRHITTNNAVKHVKLIKPADTPAYVFESYT